MDQNEPESVASLPYRLALDGVVQRLQGFISRAVSLAKEEGPPEGEDEEAWYVEHRNAATGLIEDLQNEVAAGYHQLDQWSAMLGTLNPRRAQAEGDIFRQYRPTGELIADFLQRATHLAAELRRNVLQEEERGSSRASSRQNVEGNNQPFGDFKPVATSTPNGGNPLLPANAAPAANLDDTASIFASLNPNFSAPAAPMLQNAAPQLNTQGQAGPSGSGAPFQNPPSQVQNAAFRPKSAFSPHFSFPAFIGNAAQPRKPFPPSSNGQNSKVHFGVPNQPLLRPPMPRRAFSPVSSRSLSPMEPQRQTGSRAARSTIQLPKVHLPQFGGDPADWPQFWQVFDFAVHSNEELPDQLKLSYLLGQLVQGSVAQRAVSGFDCDGDNYEHVVETLQQRFGDRRRQTDHLLDQLLELPPTPNTTKGLRDFVDIVDRNCRQLEKGGTFQDDPTLLRILKSKLPAAVLSDLCKTERRTGIVWDLAYWCRELNELVAEREEVDRVTRRLSTTQIHRESRQKQEIPPSPDLRPSSTPPSFLWE
jgi:hypothetical protein